MQRYTAHTLITQSLWPAVFICKSQTSLTAEAAQNKLRKSHSETMWFAYASEIVALALFEKRKNGEIRAANKNIVIGKESRSTWEKQQCIMGFIPHLLNNLCK